MAIESFPIPSLDRPFGVHLWPHFSRAFELVAGYPADEFKFVVGTTPMSTLRETSIFVAVYYTIIFGGREVMRNRAPFKLRSLFLVHNFVFRRGIFYAICHRDGGWTNRLVVLYYLTYLTKYLELLDTIFLFLKKKPLTFLHCYHHGATAVLCYTQLIGNTAVSWVPITLNLLVHVVMYWYYFQSARGIRIWWKEWVTRLQIIQFVIDLGFVYFASYTYFTSEYFPWMPNAGHCAGEEFAAFAGIIVISSYLALFILFYFATYNKDGKPPSTRRTLRRMSQAEVTPKATGSKTGNASVRARKVPA